MKKLSKYNNYNLATEKITGEEKRCLIFSDTTPSDYTDIHTIENIKKYGSRCLDYQQIRAAILEIATTTGFENLTLSEKEIVASYCVYHEESLHTASEAERATLSEKANLIVDGTLIFATAKLAIDIKKGILLRKQVGTKFVESNYSSIMLSVALGNANEDTANLVENTFAAAISHIQNGLFISSYNAIQLVVPSEATQDVNLQAFLTQLKAQYSATVLQMCYDYYPIEVLQNTPSIPPQNL